MRGKRAQDKLSHEEESQIKKDFKKLAVSRVVDICYRQFNQGDDKEITRDEFMNSSYAFNCEMFKLLVNIKVRREMGFTQKPTTDKEIMQSTGCSHR